jgi:hypothetical protein
MKKAEPNSFSWRFIRYVIFAFSLVGIVCSVMVLFSKIQVQIIQLAEQYLIHRKVNFYDQWMRTLSAWAKGYISLILIFDFFALTKKGSRLLREITEGAKIYLSAINFKLFIKPFLFASGVYLF